MDFIDEKNFLKKVLTRCDLSVIMKIPNRCSYKLKEILQWLNQIRFQNRL